MRDIGKNIRQLREQAGMTQEAFAEKLFVTRQTVSNYENGRTRPDLEMLVTIAGVLHADVNHLLYGVPTPPDKKRLIWQLIAGGAASALLITVLTVLTPKALNFVNRSYLFAPIDLLRIVAAPAAFLILGWTLMQILRQGKLTSAQKRILRRQTEDPLFFLYRNPRHSPQVKFFTMVIYSRAW